MQPRLLLITPPFTQLNTPYPATSYLKGFLNTHNIPAYQADLGIEVILALFSKEGLERIFSEVEQMDKGLSDNAFRIFCLKDQYIQVIDPLIRFLQYKNPTLAYSICDRKYLPEAARFDQVADMDWAFGTMGIQDKARHLATLFLEDIGDFIAETLDPHFGFSRYAERLGRSASHFDEIEEELNLPNSIVSDTLCQKLSEKVSAFQPNIVCISVPFPGNLFGAFKCGQYLKKFHPHIKVVMGGGYPNTELRSLQEPRVFDYCDYITLDDGEAPLLYLLAHLSGQRPLEQLKRCFTRVEGQVKFYNGAKEKDIAQRETGTPDFSDLPLDDFLSVIEIINPMHRLWSDGRWNKLTMAHGCYWGKCSFCDISLDYIQKYEPLTAALLCDRIETILSQTHQNGFHFVDEAAPPALMRDMAIEIIRRKIVIVWWTNIRFEKSFTPDLCQLLRASGCIAVSGGLEVASDRLLERMKKGVTVAQVARVTQAFTQAGIMVHAYLMYGFPTQTVQETVDSLEIVRQLFQNQILYSGFWHLFAMTAHSPVGLHPAEFDVQKIEPHFGGFADNDLEHQDPLGATHTDFSEGLRKSLFNFMNGIGLELPLSHWFDFKIPRTTIPKTYIQRCLDASIDETFRPHALVIWLGGLPVISEEEEDVEEESNTLLLTFYQPQHIFHLSIKEDWAAEFADILTQLIVQDTPPLSFAKTETLWKEAGLGSFNAFLLSENGLTMRNHGLLII